MSNQPSIEELDLTFVEETIRRVGTGKEKVLELLQAIQGHYGYLPSEALRRVSDLTEITPAAITGVSTFYDQFRHRPAGQHTIRVCIGTACHVKGGQQVFDSFKRYLRIPDEEDTDAEKLFTVEKVACIGCCMLAPAIQIDDVVYGFLNDHRVPIVLKDFLEQQKAGAGRKRRERIRRVDNRFGELRICLDSSCRASGSGKVYESLKQAVDQTRARAVVKSVGCSGMSYLTPLVDVVLPDGRSFRYGNVGPQDAKGIVLRHFQPGWIGGRTASAVSNLLDRMLSDDNWEPVTRYCLNVRDRHVHDFMNRQKHIATEHSGHIDPESLDDYVGKGGFKALERCLKDRGPAEILSEIERSGLRGRGGAGYPTHRKWQAVQSHPVGKKYVVCNGDEGDPGAFMDRMLIESYPYRIIEGMAIAARCVGSDEGYLYIRAEYPLAITRINHAIAVCRERGLLGEKILGSDFSFDLKVVVGAGAFVCGEETALLASIEGRRGMPRLRPPYPAERGLWGRPTLINNVETYACVSWILREGAEAFAAVGTAESKGTKVFALAGKVVRGGLIEVPMGISIREIVEDIGGGITGGLKLKAVQVGGPSGGCIPASLDHLSVDYEALTEVGAMMGSGGLVALDETDCMVDIARYFLEFTQNQSCGKCTFCRIGTRRMLDILERLCAGKGHAADLEELEHLAGMVKQGSLCGLGKTAPNPVLSTMRYFRDEYEAHVQGRCPAGKCEALIKYFITDECIGCTICAQHCPTDAIPMKPYEQHEIDQEKCVRCGTCKSVCPAGAVRVE